MTKKGRSHTSPLQTALYFVQMESLILFQQATANYCMSETSTVLPLAYLSQFTLSTKLPSLIGKHDVLL